MMTCDPATPADLDDAVACLVAAFAQDAITGFLLQSGPLYPVRLARFFSLLMRARMALAMPVLVARDGAGIAGAAMGYAPDPPDWPPDLTDEWAQFEAAVPGLAERMAVYDGISAQATPREPHHYLGVIGVHPRWHGHGIGTQLLESFCALSANDPRSRGVYLETANAANVPFYARAGFVETGRGKLGDATLWCMYGSQKPRGG